MRDDENGFFFFLFPIDLGAALLLLPLLLPLWIIYFFGNCLIELIREFIKATPSFIHSLRPSVRKQKRLDDAAHRHSLDIAAAKARHYQPRVPIPLADLDTHISRVLKS